jgi:TonB family protein
MEQTLYLNCIPYRERRCEVTGLRGMGMEVGLLAGLLFVNMLFQFAPEMELGRISTRTMDTIMEAVDSFIPYDATVAEKEKEVFEQQDHLLQELEREIDRESLVVSLSSDTDGLRTVETIENFSAGGSEISDEIGAPRFIAAEIPPNCTYMPPPDYPEIARLAGLEGVVTLWLYIDESGAVRDVQLMQTSGIGSFDEAALTAALNTRWTSAVNNNMPLGVWTTLRYNFSLPE